MGTGRSKEQRNSGTPASKKHEKRKSVSKTAKEELSSAPQPSNGTRRHVVADRRKSDSIPEQMVMLEAENLVLEGDWELEKGVDDDIIPTDVLYPPPRPAIPVTDTSAFSAVDFQVMTNNTSEQELAGGTYEDVTMHLTCDYQTEILKVRALTTWMSCQKIRTRQYGNEAKPDTVLGYMKQIRELKGTFAALLAHLCRAIGIPCVIITGIYKSHYHHVGDDDVKGSRCTWNAVHVDGSWQLVHPYLICTPLATKTRTDNWKLVETSVNAPDQKPGSVLNTFFFAPIPSDFIYFCLPVDSAYLWQLMETKSRYTKFIETPFLRPAFFSSRMQLKSEQKCRLLSQAGKCNIKIQCLQNVSDIVIMYELYALDTGFQRDEGCGDLVLCGRNEDTWNIQIKFPVDGTFKLALFAKLNDWFFWIGDFKIICDIPLSNIVPAPSVPREIGYGPSNASEEAGLLAPSHEGGIVFYKPQEQHVIKFLFNEKLLLGYDIENSEKETEDLHNYGKMVMRKSEVDFVVKLPLSGEFALRIYIVDEQDTQHNVCNYLLTDSDNGRKRENVFQRKARVNLREATAEHEIEVLECAIQKFSHVKLPHDDDYLRGMRRLKYLLLKRGLRDGRMRRHKKTLSKVVDDAESSQFQTALEPNINKAKHILESLQSLEMHSHKVLEMDQKTISEIANFANPPHGVHETMIATYLLLGEGRPFIQKWGNIQTLLRRQGKGGIKHRVNKFRYTEMPSARTVHAVQQLHDSIPKQYIMSASLRAAAFYDWVANILSYLNNSSQNETDPDYSIEADDVHDNADVSDDITEIKDDETANISQDESFLDSPDIEANPAANNDRRYH